MQYMSTLEILDLNLILQVNPKSSHSDCSSIDASCRPPLPRSWGYCSVDMIDSIDIYNLHICIFRHLQLPVQPGHVVHAAPWLQVPGHAVGLGGGGGGGGGGQGGEEGVSSALGRGPGTRAGVLLHLRGSLGLGDLVKENASL